MYAFQAFQLFDKNNIKNIYKYLFIITVIQENINVENQ